MARVLLLLLVASVASGEVAASPGATTERALNAMGRMFGGSGLDAGLMGKLRDRFHEYGLEEFQDALWQGFIDFGTNASNPWGKKNGTGVYEEYNVSVVPDINVTVFESCNFLSNLAYYSSMLAIAEIADAGRWSFDAATVNGLVQSYAALTAGSAFFRGQGSPRGGPGVVSDLLDNQPIGLISFIEHQAWAPRFVNVVNNNSVYAWYDQLSKLVNSNDVGSRGALPGYTLPFGAITSSMLCLIFDEATAGAIIKLVADHMLSPADASWLLTSYVPAYRDAMAHVHLSLTDKWHLATRGVGTLAKMMYAFLWQEVIKGPWIADPSLNRLGGRAMPLVNMLGNALTGYWHPDAGVQKCVDVYPSDTSCRLGGSAHAKWHEQAGNALVDLMYLCNDLNALIRQKQERPTEDVVWTRASPTVVAAG